MAIIIYQFESIIQILKRNSSQTSLDITCKILRVISCFEYEDASNFCVIKGLSLVQKYRFSKQK